MIGSPQVPSPGWLDPVLSQLSWARGVILVDDLSVLVQELDGSWIIAAAIAVMALTSSVVGIIAALFIGLLAVPAIGILLSSYETALTPDAMVGRVSAASGLIVTIAAPAGQAIGAAVYAATNTHIAFGLYTGAALIGAIILTTSPAVRHLHSLTAANTDQPTPKATA